MGEWLEPYRDADDEMLRKFRDTGKSLSEALLFAEHGENMLCTKIVLNDRYLPVLIPPLQ